MFLVGLATIIGAFTAGLIMNDRYCQRLGEADTLSADTIKNLIQPLEAVLVPIFFVLIGLQVTLETFLSAEVWWLACGHAAKSVLFSPASVKDWA